jgi:RNA polymerase sigma factor (sigma-70 family)
MPTGPPALLLSHLRRLVEAQGLGPLSDRELLQRFADYHDEAAFAALLRRHGPMVLRVCQRVLHNPHDAEDVFQATFLVLARKATAAGWHESVAGWLHEVVHRLARKLKTGTARRLARERQYVERLPGDVLADVTGRELVAVLDEELARLPEKYRTPLVLCLLEGLTRDEAARRLGCSVRTVKRRLEQGRGLLSARLSRRGIALTVALSGALVTPAGASALPVGLVQATASAAVAIMAGPAASAGLVSASVASLTQGVLKAMFWTKCKLVAMACLTVAAVGLGTGTVAWQYGGAVAGEEPSVPAAQVKSSGGGSSDTGRTAAKPEVPPGEGTGRLNLLADAPTTDEVWEVWATLKGRLETDKPTAIYSAAFSPDGKTLATAQGDGAVNLWEVASGKLIVVIGGAESASSPVRAVRFSSDGQRVISAGSDRAVKLWDTRTGKNEASLHEHKGDILGLAFSPDGKTLASGSADETVRLWDATTGKVVAMTTFQDGPVSSLAFTPDGKILAVGSGEPDLILLDASNGRVVRRFKNHTREILSVAVSGDGRLLATASRDQTVRVWELATGKQVLRLDSHEGPVTSVTFSPDGKRLASGGKDKIIRLYDLATSKTIATLTGHTGPVYCVVFSPDGKTLASGSEDGTVKLWSRKAGDTLVRIPPASPPTKDDRFGKLLEDLVKAKKTDEQLVEAIYLAALARLPLDSEKAIALKHLEKQASRRQEALTDVLSALTNSKEFFDHLEALKQREAQRKGY